LSQMELSSEAAIGEAVTVQSEATLWSLTIPQLKEQLRLNGLKVSGRKQELIDRLLQAATARTTIAQPQNLYSEEVSIQTPTPITATVQSSLSFEDLGLHDSILSAIRAQAGWHTPTPVQQLTIPKLLTNLNHDDFNDDDVNDENDDNISDTPDAFWCEAPTGSGKTAAYVLPLLQNLWLRQQRQHQQQHALTRERISALIVCPTRELAVQIGTVVEQLSSNVKGSKKRRALSTMILHGGVPYEPQIAKLADFARFGQTLDVLVATPGRLVDVLTYYNEDGGDTSAQDAAMERRLMEAFDKHGDEVSLEQLQSLGLDDMSNPKNESIDDGRKQLINLLRGLKYLVLDEADRLLGNGFQNELDRVMDHLPQRIGKKEPLANGPGNGVPAIWMFSATFPKSIEPRLDQVLGRLGATKSPVRVHCSNSDRLLSDDIPVSVSLQKKLQRSTTVASANNIIQIGPASTIQLRTIRLEKSARTQALRKLLDEDYKDEWDRVLVFVATRYASEHVSRKLRRAGIRSSELHGKLDQQARMRRLDDLKMGKIRVLLSTDVASRGIDISGLAAVVNYDLPRSTSDFVHRVGRTGRAGKEGMAVSFVTPYDEAHMELIEERHLATPTTREVLEGFEPNEERWSAQADGARSSTPGAIHSLKGLVHDRMFGGIKGRRRSKKDRLREAAAREAASTK
jgi:ATP-dependent RNA helicase RhlE